MIKTLWTMGRDQYGDTYHDLGKHPRKALLEHFGRSHAKKMYTDKKDGETRHVGYIIAGRWITLYNISPWEN